MKNKRKKSGISEIIGTVILLGISVSLFSTVQFIVYSYPIQPSSPSVNLVGTIENDRLIIEHHGGESLSLETQISFIIETQSLVINVTDYLDDKNNDNRWGIGEIIIFNLTTDANPPIDPTGKHIEASVIDVESNTIVMRAILQD